MHEGRASKNSRLSLHVSSRISTRCVYTSRRLEKCQIVMNAIDNDDSHGGVNGHYIARRRRCFPGKAKYLFRYICLTFLTTKKVGKLRSEWFLLRVIVITFLISSKENKCLCVEIYFLSCYMNIYIIFPWPAKSKIFTIWSFTDKICRSLS